MASTPLKLKLGKMIKDYLRSAELRQNDLANRLGLSGSAVSQMIHGKIVPNHQQLETICELLALDRPKAFELYSLLSKIRTGAEEMLSPFNQLMFSLRCQRGLSQRQLSNLSGISMAHLQMFETCFDAIPTLDEARQIAPILGCTPEALLQSAGIAVAASAYSSGVPLPEDEVCEGNALYQPPAARQIALLSLFDLEEYDGNAPFHEYAADHAARYIESDSLSYENIVAVNIVGKDLSLGLPGSIQLLLAAERPAGFREIDLCRAESGRYSLQEWKNGRRREFRLAGTRRTCEPIVWGIPVLELTFRPIKPELAGIER